MGWDDDEFRVVLGGTTITYDDDKEEINRGKHGYSLESAVHFLTRYVLPIAQPPFITRESPSDTGETRHEHMTVGDNGEVVFFVTTMNEDEVVRIISLHRAKKKLRAVFEAYTGYTEEK